MRPIKQVDLLEQYRHISPEIDQALRKVLESTEFIQGPAVSAFEESLSSYLGGAHVISCGNGTDALQIAMMALGFQPGDEIILPAHTYVATAEAVALLRLSPVFADVHPETFTLDTTSLEGLISKKTRAIIPVHLYGQCAHLEPLLALCNQFGLHLIEDAAQSLGASYTFTDGRNAAAATAGTIGTTSFFPSKNLGAFGDGGAMITKDKQLAAKLRMIANHGQQQKYRHEVIGVNSRLDSVQAAILQVKLKYLNDYTARRQEVAEYYDRHLATIPFLKLPVRASYSTHVFHQYTVRVQGIDRDVFKSFLQEHGIPSMIYYPVPLHLQTAYRQAGLSEGSFPVAESLSRAVLSIPVHTEMDEEQLSYICQTISAFGG